MGTFQTVKDEDGASSIVNSFLQRRQELNRALLQIRQNNIPNVNVNANRNGISMSGIIFLGLIGAILAGVCTYHSAISIPTGFVGVPYTFKQAKEPLLSPGGPYFYNIFTTNIVLIETRPQTDLVTNIMCGTMDGVKIMLSKVEVGNQLKPEFVFKTVSRFGSEYDKYLVTDLVYHQISVICSKLAAHEIAITKFDQIDDMLIDFLRSENERQSTGLEINFVRPARPELPASLDKHYLAIAEERTLKKVLEEKKERIAIEKDSEMLIAQRDNAIALSRIDNEMVMMLRSKRAALEEAQIENEMVIARSKALSDSKMMEAEGLRAFFNIPGYAETEQTKAISQNQKIYYGDKLPTNFPLLMRHEPSASASDSPA